MRNLKDILEVLVHQRATKDTNKYPFKPGKEIDIYSDRIDKILKSNLQENDFICTQWYRKNELNKCLAVVSRNNNYPIYDEHETQIQCKLVIITKKNEIETNTFIGINNDKYDKFTLRYCTEEECEQLKNACKNKGINL